MDSHKIIAYAEIRNKVRLDRGQFGQVYRAEYNELTVAAKEIDVYDNSQEFVNTFRREVEINSQLHHDNVVKFYGACFGPFCIIMEYVEGGSLYKWIYKDKFQFGNDNIRNILVGMTSGLKYLHDLKILHRDLKSKNVLIVPGNVLSSKLCDFGVSKTLNATMNVNTQEIGTVRWMAPEVMISNTYNYKCDIYSLGVTIYEILEMDLPYRNEVDYRIMMMKAVEKQSLSLSYEVKGTAHPLFAKVFSECVQFDASSRPVLLDILLKLQNSDLSSGSDTSLEVDEDTRFAWTLQQKEYASLEIITHEDEAYALELQRRFYAQNIKPIYVHTATSRATTPPRKGKDRRYKGFEFSIPYAIDPLPPDDTFPPLLEVTRDMCPFPPEPNSPSLNLDFMYGPQSIPDVLENSTTPLDTPVCDSELSGSEELTPLDAIANIGFREEEYCGSIPEAQSPGAPSDTIVPPLKATSPSTPIMRPIREETNLSSFEKHHLDHMIRNPSVVATRLGSFINLTGSDSHSDLEDTGNHTLVPPWRVEKSRSMEPLTPKKTTTVFKWLKRLDPRSKSPDLPRDRMSTYSGTRDKPKPELTSRAQSCDVQNLNQSGAATMDHEHGIFKFTTTSHTSQHP